MRTSRDYELGAGRVYNLEKRTYLFAKAVRELLRRLPVTIANHEDGRQVIRSSGSIGANYIEANDGLGTKDFKMHAKISRKESKGTAYWLRLLFTGEQPELDAERDRLVAEANELKLIFSAIVRNSKN